MFHVSNFSTWWRRMGSYKHGKPNEEMDVEELRRAIEKGSFTKPFLHKSYVAALFWIGAKRTEPLQVRKEDVQLKDGALHVTIPAFKHGERGGEIVLPLSWYGIPLILQRWKHTRPGQRLWPFSTSTAWRIIKRLWIQRKQNIRPVCQWSRLPR